MTKLSEPQGVNITKPFAETAGDLATKVSVRALPPRVGPSAEDQVSTGTQSHLQTLALEAGAQAYASRVEHIRALVQAGRYPVDYVALGSALVDAMLRGE